MLWIRSLTCQACSISTYRHTEHTCCMSAAAPHPWQNQSVSQALPTSCYHQRTPTEQQEIIPRLMAPLQVWQAGRASLSSCYCIAGFKLLSFSPKVEQYDRESLVSQVMFVKLSTDFIVIVVESKNSLSGT